MRAKNSNPKYVPRQCVFCDTTFQARGWEVAKGRARFCSRACWRAWHQAGIAARSTPEALTQRFWQHVVKSDGCWEWTGHRVGQVGRNNYGEMALPGQRHNGIRAHRFSWELHYGPIPDGLWVLHRCDNPPCVRPDHLFLGTRADNLADMVAKGRATVGERSALAKLTRDQVIDIRQRYAAGIVMQQQLAAEYGVHAGTISGIVRRKRWRHLN